MRLFLIGCLCLLLTVTTVTAQDDFQIITAETVSELVTIGTLDGACGVFHPQGDFIATEAGLYSISDGSQLIDVSGVEDTIGIPYFSPDGQWLVMGDSIYAVETGEQLYQFEYPNLQNVFFSDDGQYAFSYDTAFDTTTWETIERTALPDFALFTSHSVERRVGLDFNTGNGISRYLSPGETYWVQIFEGIYDVSTGELLDLPDEINDPTLLESGVFSPDESLFFTGGEGVEDYFVYHVPSFEFAYELDFDTGNYGRLGVSFSPDNLYFGKWDEGVYLAETGERLFEIAGGAAFSPDSTYVITQDGVYQLPDGELIATFDDSVYVQDFTADSRLVAVSPAGVFDVVTGEQAFEIEEIPGTIFFSADDSLFYHAINAETAYVHDTLTGEVAQTLPSGNIILSDDERFIGLSSGGSCEVYGVR